MPAPGLAFFIWQLRGPGAFWVMTYSRISAMLILVAVLLVGLSSCVTVDRGWNTNGLSAPAGRPRTFQATTNFALHLGCGYFPLWGDASMEGSIDAFTKKAREVGAVRYEIVSVDAENYCQGILGLTVLPIIITPMKTTVYGHTYSR